VHKQLRLMCALLPDLDPTDLSNMPFLWHQGEDFMKEGTAIKVSFFASYSALLALITMSFVMPNPCFLLNHVSEDRSMLSA
jgi:hypothetical protein